MSHGFPLRNGRSKIVRVMAPINAGEMLTTNYLDANSMEQPVFLP